MDALAAQILTAVVTAIIVAVVTSGGTIFLMGYRLRGMFADVNAVIANLQQQLAVGKEKFSQGEADKRAHSEKIKHLEHKVNSINMAHSSAIVVLQTKVELMEKRTRPVDPRPRSKPNIPKLKDDHHG